MNAHSQEDAVPRFFEFGLGQQDTPHNLVEMEWEPQITQILGPEMMNRIPRLRVGANANFVTLLREGMPDVKFSTRDSFDLPVGNGQVATFSFKKTQDNGVIVRIEREVLEPT